MNSCDQKVNLSSKFSKIWMLLIKILFFKKELLITSVPLLIIKSKWVFGQALWRTRRRWKAPCLQTFCCLNVTFWSKTWLNWMANYKLPSPPEKEFYRVFFHCYIHRDRKKISNFCLSKSGFYFWRHEFSFKSYFDVLLHVILTNEMLISTFWQQINVVEGRRIIGIRDAFIFRKSRDGGSEIVIRIWSNLPI